MNQLVQWQQTNRTNFIVIGIIAILFLFSILYPKPLFPVVDTTLGQENAPITIIEYFAYTCISVNETVIVGSPSEEY